MSSPFWFRLSEVTGVVPQQLELEAAFSWLSNELAITDKEIATYARQYGVPTPQALEEKIRKGEIEGHPAWEDLIDWTNLIAYRDKLLDAATLFEPEAGRG